MTESIAELKAREAEVGREWSWLIDAQHGGTSLCRTG